MKVLWVNPSFLDYRIPLYANLHQLLAGNFYLLYSKSRVPQRVIDRVESELGANAIGMIGEKTYTIGKKSEFANTYVSIPHQPGLNKAIKDIQPDLIISEGFFQWTYPAVKYAKKKNIPYYIVYERTEHTERNCPKWRTFYRKWIGKSAKGFFVNGCLTTNYLDKIGLLKDKNIIEGCMCADSHLLAQKIRQKTQDEIQLFKQKIIPFETTGLTYLFVGRIILVKGVKELLEAWKLHEKNYPEDSLVLVGDGSLLQEYKDLYSKENGIYFIGGIDYNQIDNYYAMADVFVMPTLEDNWSLVVPEAMACGLPIATSIYNGCYPELVKKENGILFDPLVENSIVNALSFFHEPTADLKQMGEMSVLIEKDYSPDRVAERILDGINR